MQLQKNSFSYSLDFMDAALERLFGELPLRVRERLDYSLESLDILEESMLRKTIGGRLGIRAERAAEPVAKLL
jgi:hypothetical protein